MHVCLGGLMAPNSIQPAAPLPIAHAATTDIPRSNIHRSFKKVLDSPPNINMDLPTTAAACPQRSLGLGPGHVGRVQCKASARVRCVVGVRVLGKRACQYLQGRVRNQAVVSQGLLGPQQGTSDRGHSHTRDTCDTGGGFHETWVVTNPAHCSWQSDVVHTNCALVLCQPPSLHCKAPSLGCSLSLVEHQGCMVNPKYVSHVTTGRQVPHASKVSQVSQACVTGATGVAGAEGVHGVPGVTK